MNSKTTSTETAASNAKTETKATGARGQKPKQAEMPAESTKPNILTIEMQLDGFTPEKLENLRKLVDSKASRACFVLLGKGIFNSLKRRSRLCPAAPYNSNQHFGI